MFTDHSLILHFSIRLHGFLFLKCFLGAGIGIIFGSLMMSYSRNPSLKASLFSYAILGFALTEALALFCLMMAFLFLYAF